MKTYRKFGIENRNEQKRMGDSWVAGDKWGYIIYVIVH